MLISDVVILTMNTFAVHAWQNTLAAFDLKDMWTIINTHLIDNKELYSNVWALYERTNYTFNLLWASFCSSVIQLIVLRTELV